MKVIGEKRNSPFTLFKHFYAIRKIAIVDIISYCSDVIVEPIILFVLHASVASFMSVQNKHSISRDSEQCRCVY